MAIDLATLIGSKSAEQIYNETLAAIAAAGTRITNWRTGGPYKTLLAVEARALELLYAVAAALASGAFRETATGPWLSALGEDVFGEPRQLALSAEYSVTLTTSLGAGPYTLQPGAVIVSTASGRKFRATNANALTLPGNGGSVSVPVKAESPGAGWNVSPSTINRLDAPTYLGVTVLGTAQTAAGADEEQDDRYRARLGAKWATLGRGGTEDAYRYWALTASAEVTQVRVLSNWRNGAMTPSWVTVLVAGDGAEVSNGALAAVNAALQPPLGIQAEAIKATAQSATLTGTVYVPNAYLALAQPAALESLEALRRRTQIGGTVYRSAILDAIHYLPGRVRNAVVSSPTDPLALPFDKFLVWNFNLSWQGV